MVRPSPVAHCSSCPNFKSFIALGITDEVEAEGMRGTKKKKGRKLDEDFVVSLGLRLQSSHPLISAPRYSSRYWYQSPTLLKPPRLQPPFVKRSLIVGF
jgi:hypothetical protein